MELKNAFSEQLLIRGNHRGAKLWTSIFSYVKHLGLRLSTIIYGVSPFRRTADSVALRDVWAPATINSKAQRRRTAGGVPLPLVRARATARKYSTTIVCTDVFYCKMAMLQRYQQILCQRISLNAAAFCAPFPNILTTRPHFFRAQIRFPWPIFCCQLLGPAIANIACTLALMRPTCKRASQMPAHSPRLCRSARFQRTATSDLNLIDALAPSRRRRSKVMSSWEDAAAAAA